MRGEIHAGRFKFLAQRAGIGVAGFLAVADQDHGGPVFGVAQLFRGAAYRLGDRGHAPRVERIDLLADTGGGVRPDSLQYLDIGTVALAVVAVGHQPEVAVAPAIEHRADRLAGDGDLGLAVDLAPHRTGGVQYQHGGGLLRVGSVKAGGRQQRGGQQAKGQACLHVRLRRKI